MKNNYLLHFGLLVAMFFVSAEAWSETKILNISDGNITITSTGYKIGEAGETAFTGDYSIIQTDTQTATPNRIKVESGEHTITLDGVNIKPEKQVNWGNPAFDITAGSKVILCLEETNTLTGGFGTYGVPALHVPVDATLIIEGGKDATLNAKSGDGQYHSGAGIGSNGWETCGIIEIRGGKIVATGIQNGAGIGGGSGNTSGTLIVSGGTVTASEIRSESATISGGTVTASINSTSFSTGENGAALITGAISDKSGQSSWSCINIVDNKKLVYGDQTLQEKWTIQSDQTLIIKEKASLTFGGNGSLINTGMISNSGSISGPVTNNGTIVNSGSISSSITNIGMILNSGSISGPVTNNDGTIVNSGSIPGPVTNNGTIYNAGTLPGGIAGSVIPVEGLTSDFLMVLNGKKGTDFIIESNGDKDIVKVLKETPLTFYTPVVSSNSRIVVKKGVTADITLKDCRIGQGSEKSDYIQGAPLDVEAYAAAVVHLSGNNILYGSRDRAAIRVPSEASLTIKGSGSLQAVGGQYAAAIGGGKDESAGTIRIESGTITASGGVSGVNEAGGAGIGGGGRANSPYGYSHSKIIITGGNITACGGYKSAGIGTARGGTASDGAEIRIEGGYVKASAGDSGNNAGIGARFNCKDIIISGGTVEASLIGNPPTATGYGTVTVTGGSIACADSTYAFPDATKHPHLLTLDDVGDNVNSVSVDDVPFYIDRPHTTDAYKGHLYLYVPAGAKRVHVREGNEVVPYTISWKDNNPTPTATRGTRAELKKGNLAFEGDGCSYTHGGDYSLDNMKLVEAGGSGSTSEEGAVPMNTLSVKVTDGAGQTVYEEIIQSALEPDGSFSKVTLNLDKVPAGTYEMAIRYGGDATYMQTSACTTLTVHKGTLSIEDFDFIPPHDNKYDGTELTATVNRKKPGIAAPDFHYYKNGIEQRPVDAGTYTVRITVKENGFFEAVSEAIGGDNWQYTIDPRSVEVFLSAPAFINDGKLIGIKYEYYGILREDQDDDTRLSIAGSLIVEDIEGHYVIKNPSKEEGGLYLAGSQADNYIIETGDVGMAVEDQYTENAAGWVKVENYPFTLRAPGNFVITDAEGRSSSQETRFTEDGIYTYYLVYAYYSMRSFYSVCERILRTDGTAPVVSSTPASLTETVATFTLSDATSGIATYRVSESGQVITEYSQEANIIAGASSNVGARSLSYVYTGTPGSVHTLDIEVTDMAGNTATSSVTFALKNNPYIPPVSSYYDIYLESGDSVRLSSGSTVVEEGYSFTFTAEVTAGFDPATLVVEYKRGRSGKWRVLEAESNGKYHVKSVYDDIYVRAAVRRIEDPTALESITGETSRIRVVGSCIRIGAARPVSMHIVSLGGYLVRSEQLPAGDSEISGLQQGVYVVLLSDGTRTKVIIR